MDQHSLRVLLFTTVFPPFIADDERLLKRHFRTETLVSSGLRVLLQLPWRIAACDIVLTWFGSVYSALNVFLARLLGKRSVIIIAGVDASRDAEIDYGIWLSRWKSVLLTYAYRHADLLLVVSPFLGAEVRRLAAYPGDNVMYLPFGFDGSLWDAPVQERKRMVLTVASCENESRLKKKGVDKLFAAAGSLPEVLFCLVGVHRELLERLRPSIPGNLEVIPFLPREELAARYAGAKVYCQPSYTEGLPNTLCEAMLCGCIPVGTAAGGIPTVIGEAGYLVEYHDQRGLVDALRRALDAPEGVGEQARQRILREFPEQGRSEGLRDALTRLARKEVRHA